MTSTLQITQGLTDVNTAKAVARRLFEQYDRGQKGQLEQNDTVPMMTEAYKSFNKGFQPNGNDLSGYFQVLDRNQDGKVTLNDIEELCIKYLCVQDQVNKSMVSSDGEQVKRHGKHHQAASPKKIQRRESIVYDKKTEAHLDVARRLFKRFDTDESGELDEKEVYGLIQETYKQMGQTIELTEEDVQVWMEMTDENRDGKISLEEYENVIVRSLEMAGFKIERQHVVL